MNPSEGIATIRERYPTAGILIYSAFSTDEEVYQVFSAGARNVLKGESAREDSDRMHACCLQRRDVGPPGCRGETRRADDGPQPDAT